MIGRTTLAAAATALVAGAAGAQSIAGDPVTPERAADVVEMIRVADAVDAAVDAKEWALALSLFTPEIEVDFTSLAGGEPATIPASDLIDGWAANLTEDKASFHLRGNHVVTFEGPDAATMRSHGYAFNRMEAGADPAHGGEPMWEVWGVYTHGFARTEEGWRVDAMGLEVTA